MSEEQPKPPIEDMPPEDGLPLSDRDLERMELDVPDEAFLAPEDADADDTVDNQEGAEQPHDDLPEGARAEDYGDD